MKRRGMSLALCAAMAMGTIGVVPAMADDKVSICRSSQMIMRI